MTYSLFSEDGWIDDLCTFVGLEQIAGYIERHSGLPDLKLMIKNGYTDEPQKVIQELEFLMTEKKSTDIQTTLEHLLSLMRQVNEVAIISQ